MNVINLKILSLSTLLTSSMLCGAFAMDSPEEEDRNSKVKVNFMDDFQHVNVKALREKAQSPIKTDTTDRKFDRETEFKNANSGGFKYLQEENKIKENGAVKAQSIQQKIEDLISQIPVHKKELEELEKQIEEVKRETQAFNNNVIISKDGYLNPWAYNNPLESFRSWRNGSSETSTNVNTNNENIEIINEDSTIQSKQNETLILKEEPTSTGNPIFAKERSIRQENEDSKFRELTKEVETLESNIADATKELEEQKSAREKAEAKFNEDKKRAFLTKDMLPFIFGSPEKK